MNSIENELIFTSGEVCGVGVKQMMGIKACTCDEHQVIYGTVELLCRTPEANITLFGNYHEIERKEGSC